MDLHDLKPGDRIINSVGEEAVFTNANFFEGSVRLHFDRCIKGWLSNSSGISWVYYYNGKFLKSAHNDEDVADIVKVIKHD